MTARIVPQLGMKIGFELAFLRLVHFKLWFYVEINFLKIISKYFGVLF